MTSQQLQEAEQQQLQLRQTVIRYDVLPAAIRTVAGVDVAYAKETDKLVAAIAVLDADSLEVVQLTSFVGEATFPYVPGLFSFRELPPVIQAIKQLSELPDLLVCDGHGLAHPRRFGLACHLGIVTGIPAIGCAKTRLVGEYQPLGSARGSREDLWDQHEVVGQVLRTQAAKNPVFVSVGHKISLRTATEWVLRLAPNYRLPETTRIADQTVKRLLQAS